MQESTFHWKEVLFPHVVLWYLLPILELHHQTSFSVQQTESHAVRVSPSMEDGTIQIEVEWHTFLSDLLPQHFIVTETVVVKSACIVHLLMSNRQLGNSVVRWWMLTIPTTLYVLLFVSLVNEYIIISIGLVPTCFSMLLHIAIYVYKISDWNLCIHKYAIPFL